MKEITFLCFNSKLYKHVTQNHPSNPKTKSGTQYSIYSNYLVFFRFSLKKLFSKISN